MHKNKFVLIEYENARKILHELSKDQLVKELNKLLKANGYTREGRRQHWTKQIETGFVLIFDIQGCCDGTGDYYMRVGVSVVGIDEVTRYGQFGKELSVYSTEQVYNDAVKFFNEWTDIITVRERVQAIKEWRDRNPARHLWSLPQEKREKPPFPVPELETDIYDYVLSPKYLEDRKQF